MDVLALMWTLICLIILTVNCQAIWKTCPQSRAAVRPHLTNTVVLCRLRLITLTAASFNGALCQESMHRWSVSHFSSLSISHSAPDLAGFCLVLVYLLPRSVINKSNQKSQNPTHLFLVLSPAGVQRLNEGSGVTHKHGEAGGAHDHAEDGEPHVSHADGGVEAVADAQHVTHGLEKGVGVLLTPSVILQEEQKVYPCLQLSAA